MIDAHLLRVFSFQLHKVIRSQPALCISVSLASVFCVVAMIAFASANTAAIASEALNRTLTVQGARKSNPQEAPPVLQETLRPFNSAQVLQVLSNVALETNLPLAEVTFSLEAGAAQPYLRYRAAFTATGTYSTIRRFVDQVHSSVGDVSLDAFSCTRKNIQDTTLACDLAFSAFYRKDGSN
ncbi:hypothetical protein HHL21_07510 [Massilia sp. RP-1-19]|uniref:Uncharacterized protein n=1 Tax=Massilia polaris TaxID=2728846 RepID=A0A848HIN9_9BURK|nr:hypothetical protein [Massilia polaris]NML60932.1 hypothetical protein [Massilia polaris]